MTALALNIANRSATFLGDFIDALDKAIAMAKAISHENPSEAEVKKIRDIAETI